MRPGTATAAIARRMAEKSAQRAYKVKQRKQAAYAKAYRLSRKAKLNPPLVDLDHLRVCGFEEIGDGTIMRLVFIDHESSECSLTYDLRDSTLTIEGTVILSVRTQEQLAKVLAVFTDKGMIKGLAVPAVITPIQGTQTRDQLWLAAEQFGRERYQEEDPGDWDEHQMDLFRQAREGTPAPRQAVQVCKGGT